MIRGNMGFEREGWSYDTTISVFFANFSWIVQNNQKGRSWMHSIYKVNTGIHQRDIEFNVNLHLDNAIIRWVLIMLKLFVWMFAFASSPSHIGFSLSYSIWSTNVVILFILHISHTLWKHVADVCDGEYMVCMACLSLSGGVQGTEPAIECSGSCSQLLNLYCFPRR